MKHLQSNFELEYSLLAKLMGVSVSKHLLDEHFTVLWANDAYYELIGYPKKNMRNFSTIGRIYIWLIVRKRPR